MKHLLKISVSNRPPNGGIVGYRKVTLREKFLRFLLGEKRKLAIILPGDSVKSLSVEEERSECDG
jgi:hypothetical protein